MRILSCYMYSFKQFVRRGIPQFAGMLEDDEFAHRHISSRSRMIIFEHIDDGLPQKIQIVFTKVCDFSCQIGRNVAFDLVQGIGNNELAPDFRLFIQRIFFCRDCYARQRNLLRSNRIDASGKPKLDRAAHLSAVQSAFHKGGHDSPESTNIKEIGTHEVSQHSIRIRIFLFGRFDIIDAYIRQGFFITLLQRYIFFDVDPIPRLIFLGGFHIVSDLTFQSDIGHKAKPRFRIHARHIPRIRISIRVAIRHIEKNHEIVSVMNHFCHLLIPPLYLYILPVFPDNNQG